MYFEFASCNYWLFNFANLYINRVITIYISVIYLVDFNVSDFRIWWPFVDCVKLVSWYLTFNSIHLGNYHGMDYLVVSCHQRSCFSVTICFIIDWCMISEGHCNSYTVSCFTVNSLVLMCEKVSLLFCRHYISLLYYTNIFYFSFQAVLDIILHHLESRLF